jgi:hypothetical protein
MANAGTYNHTKQHFAEGAAAATPDSGEVVLYAKSDGLLYSKDDAGVESAVSGAGAGGSVATDAIWDAAGDLVVGTGANTAARLAIGNPGGALSRFSGAVGWNAGTSFPGSPAAGDRYWRTDLGMECFYDGTRWLTSTKYVQPFAYKTNQSAAWDDRITLGAGSVYVYTLDAVMYAGSLSGSAYWTIDLYTKLVNDSTSASLGQVSIQSGTSSNWLVRSANVNAVIDLATNPVLQATSGKVGAPGNLTSVVSVVYRRIVT